MILTETEQRYWQILTYLMFKFVSTTEEKMGKECTKSDKKTPLILESYMWFFFKGSIALENGSLILLVLLSLSLLIQREKRQNKHIEILSHCSAKPGPSGVSQQTFPFFSPEIPNPCKSGYKKLYGLIGSAGNRQPFVYHSPLIFKTIYLCLFLFQNHLKCRL